MKRSRVKLPLARTLASASIKLPTWPGPEPGRTCQVWSPLVASPTDMDIWSSWLISEAAMVTESSSVLSTGSSPAWELRCISSSTQASEESPMSNSLTIRLFMRAV